MARLRANFMSGELVSGVDDDDSTLDSAEFAGLPVVASGNYIVIVLDPRGVDGDPEIVYMTSHTSADTDGAVVRGSEGTTARAHLSGTEWICAPTTFDLSQWRNEPVLNSQTVGAHDDDFNDDSIDSNWVRVDRTGNSSNVTWTERGDLIAAKNLGTDQSSEMHALVKPMGGLTPPITIETASRCLSRYAANHHMHGLVFADGTTYGSGTQIATMPYVDNTTAGYRWSARRWTGYNNNTNDDYTVSWWHPMWIYQRLRWVSSNTFEMYTSADGHNWLRLPDNTITHSFTPTHFGLWVSHWNTSQQSIASFEYFRVYNM